jgi:hypothetical protein
LTLAYPFATVRFEFIIPDNCHSPNSANNLFRKSKLQKVGDLFFSDDPNFWIEIGLPAKQSPHIADGFVLLKSG